MSKQKQLQKFLHEVYYDPKHPSGFGSIHDLYKMAKKEKPLLNPTVHKIKQWLRNQDTYTLHKPVKKKFPRNKVWVYGMDSQWEADLADLSSLSHLNKGYKFLLTCIDVLSKFAWVIPLKNKKGDTLVKAFKQILSKGRTPINLFTDSGTEFKNKQFQKMLQINGIYHFTSRNETKCPTVERFNRTIKTKMYKYFTSKHTYKYIDVLPKLVEAYNNAEHRTIGQSPSSVNISNQMSVKQKIYGRKQKKPPTFKLQVGDKVRISKMKMTFEKGYKPNWTNEIFKISQRLPRTPPVYRIKDLLGEELEGTFYESEMQKIEKDDDAMFIIDKVLKRRKQKGKTEYFVSWKGYPKKFNSWVSDIEIA
ncbi:uncharacterized protein [Amphiura filiformis]|uniref:uncharacterized protein n=1 Tax=Amphiura filiformis TaxID=82378 RepID=UPI003B21BDFB